MAKYELIHNNNQIALPKIPDQSVDAVITDPPYPGIKRSYGTWTEEDWHTMMEFIIAQTRRVLKPSGSAFFLLQNNQSTIGTVRPWLWEFLAKYSKEWNQPEDIYIWNYAYMPTTHCSRKNGLMRPSVKIGAWFGPPDCYRDQSAILWQPSEANKAHKLSDRALKKYPSGSSMRTGRCMETMNERGGSTPFNVLPVSDNMLMYTGGKKAGSLHGAATNLQMLEYFVNYLCPEGGTVLDMFSGTSTTGEAAVKHNRNYIGIEQMEEYHKEAIGRMSKFNQQPIF